jgi:large subunit ribosomal protein L17
MRHGKVHNHLSRTASHRKAMLGNMASSILKSEKKRIITTIAKAKALRRYLEPIVTKGKENTTHSRRTVFSYLADKDAVTELFTVIAPKIGDRQGGYLRILKLGPRKSDNTEMALIEFVDFNVFTNDAPKKKTKRRSPAKKGAATKKTATKGKGKEKAEDSKEESADGGEE